MLICNLVCPLAYIYFDIGVIWKWIPVLILVVRAWNWWFRVELCGIEIVGKDVAWIHIPADLWLSSSDLVCCLVYCDTKSLTEALHLISKNNLFLNSVTSGYYIALQLPKSKQKITAHVYSNRNMVINKENNLLLSQQGLFKNRRLNLTETPPNASWSCCMYGILFWCILWWIWCFAIDC